jgi:hypothetical protein
MPVRVSPGFGETRIIGGWLRALADVDWPDELATVVAIVGKQKAGAEALIGWNRLGQWASGP